MTLVWKSGLILQSPAANDPLLDLNTQPSLDLQFATSKTLDDRVSGQNLITFSRSTTGTYVDSNGIIQTAAIDAPRFDHDPTTNASLGLLIEESRTNFLTNSEHLDTGWLYQGSMAAPTTTTVKTPDGDLDARLFTSSGGRVRQDKIPAAAIYTLSVYYKPNTDTTLQLFLFNSGSQANVTFDTTNPSSPTVTSGSGVMVAAGDGWFRASVTTSAATDGTTIESMIYTDSGYLWGAQLEAGAFPTSYIPTSGSSVPRAADVASITGSNFSRWYEKSEGTVFVDSSALGLNTINRMVYITDGSTSNSLGIAETLSLTQFLAYTGGVAQANLSFAQTGLSKKTFAYAVNDAAFTADGNSALTDTSVTLPGLDRMDLNSRLGANPLNGHIARLTYYPYRLPDATLQEITS